ncbi:ferredoxin reductase family protein [Phytohabitans aurantiacus]|jgi:predicted ferric reductase|uniref:Oxidoreductase n=1 Tax=Phytohabitans aurantiacus TaxID=3016789 RepID=A0ABQ5R8W4_9ACTN|nr:ferredoxin reductase family protein [Phytohabitans aurantiacus]GLI03199.1 oxidoreductase [Phytohabitans aurantiacus]
MTATARPLTRTAVAPGRLATYVLLGAWLAHVLVIEILFIKYGKGKNSILTVGKFFGLHTALIMMLQLTLVARVPWLDRRLGMDRLTRWHRWIGFTLLWTVLTHATIVVSGYTALGSEGPWDTFWSLAGVTASMLGMIAASIIVVVAALSMRQIRRLLGYEVWHALHLLLYVAVGIGLAHQALEGTTFTQSTAAEVYWWTVWVLVLTALVVGRIVVPVWRNVYHGFRVAAVVPEADNVVSVHVTGRHLDKLPARAGQFMIWRFPGHNNWWQANPFSLSAAPNGRSLRLTAKAVGKTSAGLRGVPVGSRVFAEGPYGAFTTLHQTRPGLLLIAGGVGITPIRALLEESTEPSVVLYRVHSEAEAVLLPELESLARERGARVHLLTGRTGAGSPPNMPFAPENLAAAVPDITERDIYVCGPLPMTEAVLRSLKALGVPTRQIHAERFTLA